MSHIVIMSAALHKIALGALLLGAVNLHAADYPAVNLGFFNGLAMNGYDVMTYWHGGKPAEGDPSFSIEWNDATWLFVSGEHRDEFAASTERFAPQYGGYCAYAASVGEVADVDAFAWRIWNDKLYLNYSSQVRRLWASAIDANIAKANALWPGPLTAND